jgi:hypothetical protein
MSCEDSIFLIDLIYWSDKLYHIMLYTSPWSRFELTSVVIVTDCLGSCISNYHTITAMTAPTERWRIAIKPLFFNIWFLHDFNMDFLSRSPSKSVLFYLLQLLSRPWSYGSWIYNYLGNQWLSPLMWVQISIRARCTTLCDNVCQWLVTDSVVFRFPPPIKLTATI